MKSTEVNDSITGKRCKSIFTGLMVTGTIEDIRVTKHTAEVKVRFDEAHNWGGQWYESDWSFARRHDEFGSLRHLEIIDDGYQTIQVKFEKSIGEIDRMFAQEHSTRGAINLKEWVDSYESSRCTQISEDTAIITSEYNMEHIEEWLRKNFVVLEISKII